MSAATEIVMRARRIAIVAQLIETFPEHSERLEAVECMCRGGMISHQTAELLIESFGLEAA